MPSPSGGDAFEWLPAQAEALKEAYRTSQAASSPVPPNWSGYAENLANRFAAWLEGAAEPLTRAIGPNLGTWVTWIVLAIAAIIVVMVLARIIESLRQPLPSLTRGIQRADVTFTDLSAAQYRAAALASLEKGDRRGALTSIWWWFGASALKTKPERDMTTNDVLSRSQRPDLRRFAQTLDRLRFDQREPAEAEVRQLFSGFEAAL